MAPELGLDLKLSASEIITSFTKEASSTHDESQRISKLQEFIANLEDERRKIEVFKRELPLCMFLLNDVIAGIKDELEQCRSKKRHVLEEFMPIKSKLEEEEDGRVKLDKDCKDKMNWMSSAQLWSDNYSDDVKINYHKYCKTNTVSAHDDEESEAPSIESKSKRSAAVVAFKGISGISRDERTVTTVGLPGLSLVARAVSALPADQPSGTSSAFKPIARSQVAAQADSHVSLSSSQQKQQQAAAAARKARRSWSPELHRRFVAALQQLGGAQVATPKQIRELMKVDGLTNDEVKSHLQKYRLHTKRIPNSSSSMNQHAVMVMGGLWVSPQQNYTKSQQSGSPQGPLQLAAAASSSRAISVTGGDSCDEDGKSESFSWK